MTTQKRRRNNHPLAFAVLVGAILVGATKVSPIFETSSFHLSANESPEAVSTPDPDGDDRTRGFESKIVKGYVDLSYLSLERFDRSWSPFSDAYHDLEFSPDVNDDDDDDRSRRKTTTRLSDENGVCDDPSSSSSDDEEADRRYRRYRRVVERLRDAYRDVSGFDDDEDDDDDDRDDDGSATYGEISYEAMEAVVRLVRFDPGDVFYDLGSGVGKFVAFVGHHPDVPVARSVGVERSASRHRGALRALERSSSSHDDGTVLELVRGDAARVDARDADVVFVSAVCFPESLLRALVDDVLARLAPGSCVVALRALPDHPRLRRAAVRRLPTSWSAAHPFFFYDVLPPETPYVSENGEP